VQVRRLFAGSNGGRGFHPFFEHIIGGDARRVYLLKGGPGTGKSRLMKDLAQALEQEGFALELFFCSSDSRSLDAFACPKLGVAVIDATFPHVMEPKLPGCRDELVNLGAFWSKNALASQREAIEAVGREKAAHFAAAFRYFAAALAVEENTAARRRGEAVTCGSELEEILKQVHWARQGRGQPSRARHLFASALTPEGYVSGIGTLSAGLRRYILVGPPGCGQAERLALILAQAELSGFAVEAFHYPLDPQRLQHLLIPELNLAVLSETALETLPPELEGERIACCRQQENRAEDRDTSLFRELVDLGIAELQRAQSTHQVVEQLYTAFMDFAAVDRLREQMLAEILSYRNRS